jgi:hypothetical protein
MLANRVKPTFKPENVLPFVRAAVEGFSELGEAAEGIRRA